MPYQLQSNGKSMLEIKKSKFFGFCQNVSSVSTATDFVENIKLLHLHATHVCWGYRLQNGIAKYSDDGEPQGTAGKPILGVLEKKDLIDVVAVVVRYYGGIQLGAGGLVRAYTQSVSMAIGDARVQLLDKYTCYKIECEYNQVEQIKYFVKKLGIPIVIEEYQSMCIVVVEVANSVLEKFLKVVDFGVVISTV
ncbi:MAG: YigZ family protein [Firmicutes bacterium]|nr:YigZ family protein [Bacillota bacterium]MCL1953143.1 YigZ family protein [Bacillota bacterium]